MVDTFNIPAILVGSLLGLLICVLVGAVVYNICKRRKMFGDDKEPTRPKVFPVRFGGSLKPFSAGRHRLALTASTSLRDIRWALTC
ncbi:hypothetical protein ElyMa_005273000 [Elysia marginata]|uniref:Uncharacterized protein n=1 Tax=Elysia marginata TaxID=1093978 RepID=A0AAV4JYV7_9GAST|nr:hypothetical protein ElyMa_005273000 [Elysia marginata]